MKKILFATALTMMCSSAFAQTSMGPAPQADNMNRPGMTSGMNSNARMMHHRGHMMRHKMHRRMMHKRMGM